MSRADERTAEPGPKDFRACGLALLAASPIYERAIVRDSAGAPTLAVVGLVARARRLLRSAYRLADAGDRLEAMILVRALLEYSITLRWLLLEPQLHFRRWARDDLKRRLVVDEEMRALGEEVMTAEARQTYRESLGELESDLAGRPASYPNLKQRAEATGDLLAYSLAYRYDSQTAAHPSTFALEQLFEERDDGIAVLPEPPTSRGYADPYAVAAYTLLDMLKAARAHVPDLELGADFDDVGCRLAELRERGKASYGGSAGND